MISLQGQSKEVLVQACQFGDEEKACEKDQH